MHEIECSRSDVWILLDKGDHPLWTPMTLITVFKVNDSIFLFKYLTHEYIVYFSNCSTNVMYNSGLCCSFLMSRQALELHSYHAATSLQGSCIGMMFVFLLTTKRCSNGSLMRAPVLLCQLPHLVKYAEVHQLDLQIIRDGVHSLTAPHSHSIPILAVAMIPYLFLSGFRRLSPSVRRKRRTTDAVC